MPHAIHQPTAGWPHLSHRCQQIVSVVLLVAAMVIDPGWIAGHAIVARGESADTNSVSSQLNSQVGTLLDCLAGRCKQFTLNVEASIPIGGHVQQIHVLVARYDDESFDLNVVHPDYALQLRRRKESTAMVLPKHRVVFLGEGSIDEADHLQPEGLAARLISGDSMIENYYTLLASSESRDVCDALVALGKIARLESDLPTASEQEPDDSSSALVRDGWLVDGKHKFYLESPGRWEFVSNAHQATIHLQMHAAIDQAESTDSWEGFAVTELPRQSMEKTFARGFRRATEVLFPGPSLTKTKQAARTVENGMLQWVEGQRVVKLSGTPEEIGTAHGKLLLKESWRCIDSVLYAFGSVQTIVTGKWFEYELEKAYAQLEKHIPERHKRETQSLAVALNIDPKTMAALNVFPEMFHCSGFALFGKATRDGKLIHGRVLDYMTTIGLQDCCVTFMVAPDKHIPFANVGYAGFTGSVSGMNVSQISLGEMGGRGEGQWDGVPMATLMRRALEECHSLEQVKSLWSDNPRTCEYYYVFADGKTRSAVGVAATPSKIEFVEPGQSHELLGEGIPDSVVLSAGARLAELRRRVMEGFGNFDEKSGIDLMCRPVAMASNLHNVLFIPEDGVLYVANADHKNPAADRPYARLQLSDWLNTTNKTETSKRADAEIEVAAPIEEMESLPPVTSQWKARDSLRSKPDNNPVAQRSLDALTWEPQSFDVKMQPCQSGVCDGYLRFPSPKPSGQIVNDLVAMEWFRAKSIDGIPMEGSRPAVVVIHESGKGMQVGRMFAQAFSRCGLHAFMIHLPFYGERRSTDRRPDGYQVMHGVKQAISDVRRSYDAVATLPNVDASRISLQGTSLGGFVASTAAAIDGCFYSQFILLAGGDLNSVLMNGKKDAANMRRQIMASGISMVELNEVIATIEPLNLAHRLPPDRTWIYSARFDDVVPPRNSNLLAERIGLAEKHHIQWMANHYSGVLLMPIAVRQMSAEMLR